MNTFILACCFVLSLLGWEAGGTTLVHRASADGSDILYSRTRVQPGMARFECVRSGSGQCHYTVYPRHCGPGEAGTPGCAGVPVRDFAVARGDSRRILLGAQSDFVLCVSVDGTVPGHCEAVQPAVVWAGSR